VPFFEQGLHDSDVLKTDGCTGAEITALCQEAALLTMQKDIDAPFVGRFLRLNVGLIFMIDQVPQSAFEAAASSVRRQVTPDVTRKYYAWSEKLGLTNAQRQL